MSITTRHYTSTGRSMYRAGVWCAAAGLLGVAQGGVLLAWPPQVPSTQYSYPFDAIGFVVAQASFAVQHLLLIPGVAALLALPAVRGSRFARRGGWAAVAGLVLLAVTELAVISARDVTTTSTHATVVNSLYGPPLVLIGGGLAVTGVAILRQGVDRWRPAPWLPALVLTLGGYIVILLIPGIMDSFTAGRVAISGWMLLFAVLGYGLTRLAQGTTTSGPSHPTPASITTGRETKRT